MEERGQGSFEFLEDAVKRFPDDAEPRLLLASMAPALEHAIQLACDAHAGQRYPSPEGEPYIIHLLRVMLAVDGELARMAAVLHDILEDTPTTAGDLLDSGVPPTVVEAVVLLTHEDHDTYAEYIDVIAENEIARKVKLADLHDNLANNQRFSPKPDVVARVARYELAIRRLTDVQDHTGRRQAG